MSAGHWAITLLLAQLVWMGFLKPYIDRKNRWRKIRKGYERRQLQKELGIGPLSYDESGLPYRMICGDRIYQIEEKTCRDIRLNDRMNEERVRRGIITNPKKNEQKGF